MSGKGTPNRTRKRSLSRNSFHTASPPSSPKTKNNTRTKAAPSNNRSKPLSTKKATNSSIPLSQTLIDLEPMIHKEVETLSDKGHKEQLKEVAAKVHADYDTLHKMIVERGKTLYSKGQCIRKAVNENLEIVNQNIYFQVGANIFDTSKTRVYPIQDTGKPVDDYIVNIEWTSEGSKIKNDIGGITGIDIIKADAFLKCQ